MTLSPPSQRSLVLNDARYRLPLMPVITAKGIIKDATEEDICEIIACGAVWAWNIATPNTERPEYRILTASLTPLADLSLDDLIERAFAGNIERQPETWDQVQAIMVPVSKGDLEPRPWLTGKQVKRILNCGRQHMINLVEAREDRKPILPLLPGTSYRQGPGGSPVIQREGFINFLKSRLVGGL